jgi:hypothetical protein
MTLKRDKKEFDTLEEIETALVVRIRRGRVFAIVAFVSILSALYPLRLMRAATESLKAAETGREAIMAFREAVIYGSIAVALVFIFPAVLALQIPTKIERSLHKLLIAEKKEK